MKAGEFKSVRSAAKEAGIVAPEVRFRRAVPSAVRALRRHFTAAELAEIKAGASLRTSTVIPLSTPALLTLITTNNRHNAPRWR